MFKVGQKVVAIKDHSQGLFKKDEIYTVTGVVNGCCRVRLKIGIMDSSPKMYCVRCGNAYPINGEFEFNSALFRPLSDIHSEWTKELVTELETEINQEQLIEA